MSVDLEEGSELIIQWKTALHRTLVNQILIFIFTTNYFAFYEHGPRKGPGIDDEVC